MVQHYEHEQSEATFHSILVGHHENNLLSFIWIMVNCQEEKQPKPSSHLTMASHQNIYSHIKPCFLSPIWLATTGSNSQLSIPPWFAILSIIYTQFSFYLPIITMSRLQSCFFPKWLAMAWAVTAQFSFQHVLPSSWCTLCHLLPGLHLAAWHPKPPPFLCWSSQLPHSMSYSLATLNPFFLLILLWYGP